MAAMSTSPAPHGSPESHAAYGRVIAEWEAAGRRLPELDQREQVTVDEVAARYVEHCETHYRHPDRRPTQEVQ